MKVILDVTYSEKTNEKLDIYLPEKESFPVFVYYHGGGITAGDKKNTRPFYEHLASSGIAVVTVNYRLYPNAKYPDFIEDCAEAASWVYKNIARYGKIEGIYLGGSSAGGYISQMLCFDKKWLAEYGLTPMDFSGFVHDAGQPTCHFNVLKARGFDSRRIVVDEYSPLYFVGSDEKYPPMLIIVSDNDMKNRYEQTMLLMETLDHFGHGESAELIVMSGKHCAYLDTTDQDGKNIFGKIVEKFILK